MGHKIAEDSWLPQLAQFLREEAGAEAVLLDEEKGTIAVATLGAVDRELLAQRLTATINELQNQHKSQNKDTAIPEAFAVKRTGGQTLVQKPSCYTAPKLWRWREVAWPSFRKQTVEQKPPSEGEWRWLLALAGGCAVLGGLGFGLEKWTAAPQWLSILCYVGAMLAGGWEAMKDMVKKLPKGQLDIHFLMLAVALGAAAIGAWEEGALLLFLFSFAEAMEHFVMHRSRRSIDALFEAAPQEATVVEADGTEQTIAVEQLQLGQQLKIRPGDLFPVDAEVLKGATAADESNLTGEATPVNKEPGDTVYSGTINLWGVVQARVLRPASESSLQKIIRLIEDAQHLKAPSQRFTDRFGPPYTYVILSLTIVMFFIWWQGFSVSPFTNTATSFSAFYRAMTLLVVASPCALVISIPSVILAAIAWGAQRGILFRGGAAIEKLSQIDIVALDKTGTLTTGDLAIDRIESFPPGHEQEVLESAYALEHNSTHPIAQAIVNYCKKQNIALREVDQFKSLTGQGVQGRLGETQCLLGRRNLLRQGPLADWVEKLPQPTPEYTEVWVLFDKTLGRILLKDEIRKESKPVLQRLQKDGLRTVMLTGDRRETAEAVGTAIGLTEVRSGLAPEDKVAAIQAFSEQGHYAAMVGDGVNDAPSLAAAYVAVAMGARGSDAALEQSEVVLMNDRIDNFLAAYELSRRARRIIHQNLAIALGVIGAMVLGALVGWVPLTVGVFSHEGSTVLVCLNSLRLLFQRGD